MQNNFLCQFWLEIKSIFKVKIEMFVTVQNLLELFRILLFFGILFILLPVLIKKPKKGNLIESIVIGFCISAFSGVIATYFLVVCKMYGLFSFLLLYIGMLVIIYFWIENIKFRDFKIKEKAINFLIKLFDWVEKERDINWVKSRIQKIIVYLKNELNKKYFLYKLTFICFVVFVFIYIFLLRLFEVISHTILYYSDSYGHLLITKLFLMGKSFYEKFYPIGYHSLMADIKIVSFSDLVDIIRFIGPIQSVVIMFSIYCFVFLVTKNKYSALLSTAILGLDSLDIWPQVFYRQLVALPQEFATIFFLPAIYFCLEYLIKQKSKYLKCLFISLANIFLIHLYVGILIIWPLVGIFIVGIFFRLWRIYTLVGILLMGILSCLVGVLPFVIWFVFRLILNIPIEQYGSMIFDEGFLFRYVNFHMKIEDLVNFLWDAVNPIKDPLIWHNQTTANLIIYSLFISVLFLIFRVIFRRKFYARYFYLAVLAISQTFLIVFYYGFKYHLVSIMYFERVGLVLSINGVVTVGFLFNEIFAFLRNMCRKVQYKLKLLKIAMQCVKIALVTSVYIVIMFMIIFLPYEKPDTQIYQYEGAIKAYKQIKKGFEFLDWTVISPVEEFSLTYGYGFHYELWKFLQDFSIEDAKNKDFDFGDKIPSKHIFIFLEKEPLLVWYTIPPTVYHISETEKYYRMYHSRKKLEKKLQVWVEAYRNSHKDLPNNAKVFYEDENIVVYHIEHHRKKVTFKFKLEYHVYYLANLLLGAN